MMDKPPLKDMIELEGMEVYFEAIESEAADRLPSPSDWWIERVINTQTGEQLSTGQKCAFEIRNDDTIHWLIHDKCKRIMENSNEDFAIRNFWNRV